MSRLLWRYWGAFRESFAGRNTRRSRRRERFVECAAEVELLEPRRLLTVPPTPVMAINYGGELLTHIETQAVYLGKVWSTNSINTMQPAPLDKFLNTLVSGQYMDMLTNAGYQVFRGTSTKGVTDDISLLVSKSPGEEFDDLPGKTGVKVTDTLIQHEIQSLIQSPDPKQRLQTPDANRVYVVYVEQGAVIYKGNDTSVSKFFGYHSAFAGMTAAGSSVDIHYAVIAYPGGPNPTARNSGFLSDIDDLTVVTSHEIAEAATDPNGGYKLSGWFDDKLGKEIGDNITTHVTFNQDQNQDQNQYQVQEVFDQHGKAINPNDLQAPRNVNVTATSSTTALLSWNRIVGTRGYRVYNYNIDGITLVSVDLTTTFINLKDLKPGSRVSFKVEAFNATSFADSEIVSVTMPLGKSAGSPLTPNVLSLKWVAVETEFTKGNSVATTPTVARSVGEVPVATPANAGFSGTDRRRSSRG